MSDLVPAIRCALCDKVGSVRYAASGVVSLLYDSCGPSATTPIVNWLLKGLAKDDARCLDGLEQLLLKQPIMVLPTIMDTLPTAGPPWQSVSQVRGLGTLAQLEVNLHFSGIFRGKDFYKRSSGQVAVIYMLYTNSGKCTSLLNVVVMLLHSSP